MVSVPEPAARSIRGAGFQVLLRATAEASMLNLSSGAVMEPGFVDGMPNDVLIVEDDPIIALDFEDTLLGFGVKTVRTAGSVARALALIDQQPPAFALLAGSLIREKSFAVAERLDALNIPFAFVTGYGADARLPAALAG